MKTSQVRSRHHVQVFLVADPKPLYLGEGIPNRLLVEQMLRVGTTPTNGPWHLRHAGSE
jgi:hypothetical protein